MDTTPAILLRRTKFSETSLIVEWLTQDFGKIKTMAKGARRPKSPFAGKLDLFFEGEIQFSRSKTSDLHTLKEVVLRESHEGLRLNYQRVQLAAYFVELLELTTEPEHPTPELFDLMQRALNYLQNNPATKRALLHFEAELVRLLGIAGQAETAASTAIMRVYHKLPRERAALVDALE
jgi:DNA repair protein RecO (recombination protein O)